MIHEYNYVDAGIYFFILYNLFIFVWVISCLFSTLR